MALCLEPFGEEVARGAQFIEDWRPEPSPLDELLDRWNRTSGDFQRLARENPGAALGAGLAAGILMGFFLGIGRG